MSNVNRLVEIKKRLKQGKYFVPHGSGDIKYLLSELNKTRLERNQQEAFKNYYKEKLARYMDTGLTPEQVKEMKEKQTQKLPRELYNWWDLSKEERAGSYKWYCPECYAELSETEKYCPYCGQAIDWK